MKQRLLICWQCLIIFVSSTTACDICGGFMLNTRAGLMTRVNASFFTMTFGHVQFDGRDLTYDKDVFHQFQLSGQYHFSDRWSLGGVLGYSNNVRRAPEGNIVSQGWTNTTLQAFYMPYTRAWVDRSITWRTGAGFRLPTGKYDDRIHDRDLPENFNPSDGSWGGNWMNDLIYTQDRGGVLLNTQILIRNEAPDDSRLGHQANLSMNAFYHHQWGQTNTLVPSVGWTGDWIGKNKFPNGNSEQDTGGFVGLLNMGINFDNQTIGASLQALYPLSWSLNGAGFQPQMRWTAQFTYFIKQNRIKK